MKNEKENNQNEVVINRIINQPREAVFKLWSDPEHLPRWFAPPGCTIVFHELDIREGGRFHSCLHVPDYKDCWCIGDYLEVKAPEKIVFTMAVSDDHGNKISAVEANMDPDWPDETIVTVTLKDLGGKTELTLRQTADATVAKRTGAYNGWLQMLDVMEELMAVPLTK